MDLLSKARVISAKQLDKVEPSFRVEKDQKEINTLVNTAVQKILLNNDSTENILNDVLNIVDYK